MSQALICMLAIIAALVAYGLYRKKVMWKWIVLYWCVLTLKNIVDMLG